MRGFRFAVTVLVFLAAPLPVIAQTCIGQPSLNMTAAQFSAGLGFTSGEHLVGGSVTSGRDALFSSGGVEYASLTNSTVSAIAINAGIGGQAPLGSSAGFCPLFGVATTFGPNVGLSKPRVTGLEFGGQVGVVAGQRGAFSVVPTFGIAYVHSIVRNAGLPGVRGSLDYGVASLGVGIRFSARTAFTPMINLPLNSPVSNDPLYVLQFSFSIPK